MNYIAAAAIKLSGSIKLVFKRCFGQKSHDNTDMNIGVMQSLMRNSLSGMILVDAQNPTMLIIYANPAFEIHTGYKAEEVVGKNCRFLQGSDRQQEGRTLIREAIQARKACAVTIRNYRKDGTMFWNEVRISPIYDDHGKLVYFLGVQNDITERKEAEIALARSEARYRQMFDNNRAVKLVIDPATGLIKDANSAAVDFYGWSHEQLLQMRIQEINLLPDDEVRAEMQRAAVQERTFFEFRHWLASGEIRDVDVFSSPVDTPEGRYLYSIVVDVTGKRAAARRYRSLFEQSNDAVFILDLEGRHLQSNQRAADMLGYTLEEMTRMSYRDTIIQDEYYKAENILKRLLDGEHIPPYERTFRHRNGTPIYTEINLEIVRDENGHAVHYQSLVRDISERKRMENALRTSEERQRAILRVIPDLIFRIRSDGTYLDCRTANPDLFLFSPNDLIGKHIDTLLTPAAAQHQLHVIQQALESGCVMLDEFELPTKDSQRQFESRIVPSGADEVVTIARDVTQLWQIKRDLEIANARLEFSVDAARIAWWELDTASGKLQLDPRAANMMGYLPERFRDATYHTFISLVHPEDHPQMMQSMTDLMDGRKPIYAVDIRVKTASGDWMWFHDRGERGESFEGQPIVHGFIVDINERKQAEQQDFALALEQERTHLLSQFIQDAAHEFRTPLAIISASAYIISRVQDPVQRAEKKDQIDTEVKRIARLVDMLLMTAKVERRGEIVLERLNTNKLLEGLCQNMGAIYPLKPELRCEFAPKLPDIMGDQTYLMEAIRQIVDNAYQFTPPEGVVTFSAGMENDHLCIQVRDTGTGVSEEDLPHIFETFWRRDDAHTTEGFGLGLPITQRIIRQHGGIISVESHVGKGTCFRILLPVHP